MLPVGTADISFKIKQSTTLGHVANGYSMYGQCLICNAGDGGTQRDYFPSIEKKNGKGTYVDMRTAL